jgi:hypothetical protein
VYLAPAEIVVDAEERKSVTAYPLTNFIQSSGTLAVTEIS